MGESSMIVYSPVPYKEHTNLLVEELVEDLQHEKITSEVFAETYARYMENLKNNEALYEELPNEIKEYTDFFTPLVFQNGTMNKLRDDLDGARKANKVLSDRVSELYEENKKLRKRIENMENFIQPNEFPGFIRF